MRHFEIKLHHYPLPPSVSFPIRFMLKPNKSAGMISLGVGDLEMKSIAFAFIFVFSITLFAQQPDMQMNMQPKPVEIYAGLGSWHHATSTKNPEAQNFFDQGLR